MVFKTNWEAPPLVKGRSDRLLERREAHQHLDYDADQQASPMGGKMARYRRGLHAERRAHRWQAAVLKARREDFQLQLELVCKRWL